MFGFPLVVFLACLPIICWADVQVSAPNCTETSFAWVSYPWLVQPSCRIRYIKYPHPAFMPSRSIRLDKIHVQLRRT